MLAFRLVISEDDKSYQIEVEGDQAKSLVGYKIGDEFDGSIVGLKGYKLKITGGSDKNGFPMKKDIEGPRRIRSLLSGGVGFKPKIRGQRRRKTLRGNTISEDIVQINTIITKKGEGNIEEILKV